MNSSIFQYKTDWNITLLMSTVYNNFWTKFTKNSNISILQKRIQFLLKKYGTTLFENRFAAGMQIEDDLVEYLTRIDIESKVVPQAKRIDINITCIGDLSVKYSKGDVILHNSRGENKDVEMVDTIIFTPTTTYLIIPKLLSSYNINLEEFIINRKDSLVLSKKIFTVLKLRKYPFTLAFDLNVSDCQNVSVKTLLKADLDETIPWI